MKDTCIYRNNETIKKLDAKLKSLNPKKDNKLIKEINEMICDEYHKSLKTAVIDRLQEVIELITKEDYEKLDNLLDNDIPYGFASFISFSDLTGNRDLNDIGDIVSELSDTRPLDKNS